MKEKKAFENGVILYPHAQTTKLF